MLVQSILITNLRLKKRNRYAILGAPIIIAADIRSMESWAIDLYTAPEVLEVDQDRQCIQGSLSRAVGATVCMISGN
jgi:hypothetical protein